MQEEITAFLEYLVEIDDAPENTIKTYKRILDKLAIFIAPQCLTISQIRKHHLQEFIDSLPDKYTVSTKNSHIYVLRSFFRFLLKYDFIEGDVSTVLEAGRSIIKIRDILDKKEIKKLLSFDLNSTIDFRDKAIFLLYIDTGATTLEVLTY